MCTIPTLWVCEAIDSDHNSTSSKIVCFSGKVCCHHTLRKWRFGDSACCPTDPQSICQARCPISPNSGKCKFKSQVLWFHEVWHQNCPKQSKLSQRTDLPTPWLSQGSLRAKFSQTVKAVLVREQISSHTLREWVKFESQVFSNSQSYKSENTFLPTPCRSEWSLRDKVRVLRKGKTQCNQDLNRFQPIMCWI